MNVLSYVLSAINLFKSDRPRRRRLDTQRSARNAWAWAQRRPIPATIVLSAVALVVLFAILAWGVA